MTHALAIFLSSIVVFTLFVLLTQYEARNARRLVGGRFRGRLDYTVIRFEKKWEHHWRHVSRYILQLGWYYGLHSLLRTVLSFLVSMYSYLERIFENNRVRTRALRIEIKRHIEASHLIEIAHHKRQTKLSPEQQEALRKKKLEQDY